MESNESLFQEELLRHPDDSGISLERFDEWRLHRRLCLEQQEVMHQHTMRRYMALLFSNDTLPRFSRN